jgi:hypothetical protein
LPLVMLSVERFARSDDRSDRLASRPSLKHRPVGGAQRQIGQERRIGKSGTPKIWIEPRSLENPVGLKTDRPSSL